jgi:arsenite-transporting ATPase
MIGIDALIASLPSWTLVGGKGGVGKTTCAAAIATACARQAIRTLILSTDPAGALTDVLGAPLSVQPHQIDPAAPLFAAQLDAQSARGEFLASSGSILATIMDRGTYLDRDDIQGLIDAALPGIDETMALLSLADIAAAGDWERVVLDTAPTGHTLRLLALPDTFSAVIDLLDTMQGKHRFMVKALMRRYRSDEADVFLADLRSKVDRLRALLTDMERTGVVLVTRPESVVVAETRRYAEALSSIGMTVRAVVLNAVAATAEADAAIGSVRQTTPDATFFVVPNLGILSPGRQGVSTWSAQVRRATKARSGVRSWRSKRGSNVATLDGLSKPISILAALPPVLIVGGKGGVGKTSVSCALALASARDACATFLVSTDPAPSVADALNQPVGDADTQVIDGFGLVARQVDASAAFARWRGEYQARVDAAFDGLLGPGLDATHDRAVARDLFALAPPGIDELYALIWLGDAIAERKFGRIIIDPAPTGHLVRLLEMPALALDWSHRLLRLMLKYRELAGGGETSADLLGFARRTRAVSELLADATRSGVMVVALDEPIVRLETSRVVDRVQSLGNAVPAILWNRARHTPAPLPVEPSVRQFVAAELDDPPVGVSRLLEWFDDWRALTHDG